MVTFLPPPVLALFVARPPLDYLPPVRKSELPPYSGIASLVSLFENTAEVDLSQMKYVESRKEKRERIQKERNEKHAADLEQAIAAWDPKNDPRIKGDPHKTLFVSRMVCRS